jgi:DNA-binding MarR family transcriptional regulator
MGLAEEAFDRLRRIAFEGEHIEKMAALVAQTELSPGVIKTLMRLSRSDGVSMGEMARSIGCDPSYITARRDGSWPTRSNRSCRCRRPRSEP